MRASTSHKTDELRIYDLLLSLADHPGALAKIEKLRAATDAEIEEELRRTKTGSIRNSILELFAKTPPPRKIPDSEFGVDLKERAIINHDLKNANKPHNIHITREPVDPTRRYQTHPHHWILVSTRVHIAGSVTPKPNFTPPTPPLPTQEQQLINTLLEEPYGHDYSKLHEITGLTEEQVRAVLAEINRSQSNCMFFERNGIYVAGDTTSNLQIGIPQNGAPNTQPGATLVVDKNDEDNEDNFASPSEIVTLLEDARPNSYTFHVLSALQHGPRPTEEIQEMLNRQNPTRKKVYLSNIAHGINSEVGLLGKLPFKLAYGDNKKTIGIVKNKLFVRLQKTEKRLRETDTQLYDTQDTLRSLTDRLKRQEALLTATQERLDRALTSTTDHQQLIETLNKLDRYRELAGSLAELEEARTEKRKSDDKRRSDTKTTNNFARLLHEALQEAELPQGLRREIEKAITPFSATPRIKEEE